MYTPTYEKSLFISDFKMLIKKKHDKHFKIKCPNFLEGSLEKSFKFKATYYLIQRLPF